MTSMTQTAEATRPAIRPRIAAKSGLFLLLGANVAAVTTLFAQAGLSDDVLISIGRLAGLYGALAMAFQLLLVARLPWLDRRIGMDRLTTWHRWTGFTILWTLLAHLVFIVFGYAEVEHHGVVDELVDMANQLEGILRALVAFAVILIVGAASAKFARRMAGLRDVALHPPLHLRGGVPRVHAPDRARDVVRRLRRWRRATGGRSGSAAGAAVLAGRVLLPLWRNLRHRLRVTAVVSEAPDVVSVYMSGKHLDRMPVRATSSSCGGSSPRTAGTRPTPSRCPRRPTAARCA